MRKAILHALAALSLTACAAHTTPKGPEVKSLLRFIVAPRVLVAPGPIDFVALVTGSGCADAVRFDYGDGTASTAAESCEGMSCCYDRSFSREHTYRSNGTFEATARVFFQGTEQARTTSVTVHVGPSQE